MKVGACMIVRDEEDSLPEWLAYHLALGFDAVVVLDNLSTDGTRSVVERFGLRYDVRYVPWPDRSPEYQIRGYDAMLDSLRLEFDWLCFIDSDEFMVLAQDARVQGFLARFPSAPAVAVSWAMFGSSGHNTQPFPLVTQSFQRRSEETFPPNTHVKSFVRPAETIRCVNPHYFDVVGEYVTASGAVATWSSPGVLDVVPDYSVAKINHYFTKSRQQWEAKLRRGYPNAQRAIDEFELHYDRNEVEDVSALRLIPHVEAILASPNLSDTHLPPREPPGAEPPLSFDSAYYRGQLPSAEWLEDAVCVEHYLTVGWREGLDPSSWFSTRDYLVDHPAVGAAAICPLVHFLVEQDGLPSPSGGTPGSGARARRRKRESADDLASRLFDAQFYAAMNPDVAAAGVDLREHFDTFGWRERRDPAPWFSVNGYLLANPDVDAADVNPFRHWLGSGRREGRPLGKRALSGWAAVMRQRDVQIETTRRRQSAELPIPVQEVVREGSQHLAGQGLVVAFGADDYRNSTGGVQTCLRHEVQALQSKGFDYLYLFPVHDLPSIAFDDDTLLRPVINGALLPLVRSVDVAELALELARFRGQSVVRAVVHSLLGQAPEALNRQILLMGAETDYWVHDFGAVCSSYTLMRNNLVFCGGPPPSSGSCRVCTHGGQRPRYLTATRALLENPLVRLCAPSESAAQWFHSSMGTTKPVEVVPHGHVVGTEARPTATSSEHPPTLAFLGHPSVHKGSEAFLAVRRWAMSRGGLRLVHLGAREFDVPGIEFHQVDSTSRLEMSEALLEYEVDAALVWPLWPETFSLVTFEALAAGCAIVTHEGSGNVVAAAREAGRALVLDDQRRLERAVLTGRLASSILESRSLRPRPSRFVWTGLTPARMGLTAQPVLR
jgi:glycosyltransferase involved in cell wall biosynthesis